MAGFSPGGRVRSFILQLVPSFDINTYVAVVHNKLSGVLGKASSQVFAGYTHFIYFRF